MMNTPQQVAEAARDAMWTNDRASKALGMRVLALRRRPEQSHGDVLVDEALGNDRLLELMARADYVVAAAPLTPDTKGLIDAAAIAAMKQIGRAHV